MSVVAIAGVELRRFLRDRSTLFFVFIFPIVLVMLIGAQFGDASTTGKAVVVGPESTLRSDLVRALTAQDLEVSDAGKDAALEQVARARADVAVLVDAGADAAYTGGEPLRLPVVASAQVSSTAAVQEVGVALQRLSARSGQLAALVAHGVPEQQAAEALRTARLGAVSPTIEVQRVDELAREFEGMGQFDFGASGQLLLFVFLSSLTGAASLIQARRLGVVARVLAAPVTPRQALAGQALGRFAIAAFQGSYIMVATAVLFGVGWGTWWLSGLVLVLFALVAAGAAMLIGSLVDNEGAASGIGVGLGLVLAALGGSMFPLELFPDTMARVARLTPHAWAYEALADVQRRGAGLVDILPELGVLAAMAAALLLLGSLALRRSLSRAL